MLLGGLAVPAVAPAVLAAPLPCLRAAFLIASKFGTPAGGADRGLLNVLVSCAPMADDDDDEGSNTTGEEESVGGNRSVLEPAYW